MKKNYQQPVSNVLEMSVETTILAGSEGGANQPGGGGQDMPWGSNKRESLDWDKYMK